MQDASIEGMLVCLYQIKQAFVLPDSSTPARTNNTSPSRQPHANQIMFAASDCFILSANELCSATSSSGSPFMYAYSVPLPDDTFLDLMRRCGAYYNWMAHNFDCFMCCCVQIVVQNRTKQRKF